MQDDAERLRHAIRVGNIGIFEHDHENDVIFWSLELRQIYGWDPDEPATLGKILSHVHPDDAQRVGVAVRQAHAPGGDGYFDIEHRIIDRQGRVRWVQTRSQTHFTEDAPPRPSRTIGAVQDTTERQLAAERLRVLDTVLSSSTRAIAITDNRGTLTFANAALCRLWGYPDHQVLLGRSLFDFWKVSGTPEAALARIREERIQTIELPARRVNGTPFDLGITAEAVCDATGALAQVLVTFRDVTESKRIQDALRLKDQAIASSLIGIAVADAAENIIYANAEFLRLAGLAREEDALGRSLWYFCEPADAQTIAARLAERGGFQGEIAGKRPDGGPPLYLNVSARALLGQQGELVNIVGSFADVTDRKALEAQLVHAQKMESVGRLAGGIAHDFNNLLTIISGGLQLGLVELPADHPSHSYLADAADASQSAATLTHQLLAFSRKEVIVPKALDLNEVIRRIEKMILRLVGEDVQLVTICGPNVAPILFDPGQVEQIILNLAVNARDAMTNGGRLTIETSNVFLDSGYSTRHVNAASGMHVLLAVSDNGAGLTPEARAHLFEPFFTTKGPGKGTGLGLAMVYGAVQQNGGRIEVYSEPGQGTTFKIYLPAVAEAPTPAPARVAASSVSRTATILLVEDDRGVRKFAADVLTRFGYDVRSFPSGDDALAALSSVRPVPDMLITDVVMPGINGRILAERVAASIPGIRVLFVSGYTHNVIVNHGVLKDGIEFLAKPYSIEQLTQRVRQVLDAAPRGPLPKR